MIQCLQNRQVQETTLKYHQLTQVERYQIQIGLAANMSIKAIAKALGRHRSTVFRELKRNGHISREGYAAIYSQAQYRQRRKKCRRKFLIRGELKAWIDQRLKCQWSPEQIAGRRNLERQSKLGTETVYRYVKRDRDSGGDLWLNLRHLGRRRRQRFGPRRWPAHAAARTPIAKRSRVINERKRTGDYERDLIVGHEHCGHLLTVIDRRTQLARIRSIGARNAENTHKGTLDALKDLKVKSITNDNGFEFSGHQKTSKRLGVKIYFTRPYASWERGSIENLNKLVRQYFPKGTKFSEVDDEAIKVVETLLNERPRKKLGFRTPLEANPCETT